MKDKKQLPASYRSPFALSGLPCDVPVAVALSGGADSVALLHMLLQEGAPRVSAIHVHHGIRGAEADRDEAFCRALTARLGVPLTVVHVDVPRLAAERGLGLESAAREARYLAFAEYLNKESIPLLVTAHHADDQLETMLQHLLRGSGLRGLCGIPACRALDGALVARPLLLLSKAQILAYCEENALAFVTDTSNAEPCCPRNRLRATVLPVLAELWPEGSESAARCAALLAADEAYLSGEAKRFLDAEGNAPRVAALRALPRPILVRVMQQLLPKPPEAVHLEALCALLEGARPNASLSLPGARVYLFGERLCVQVGEEKEIPYYEVALREGVTSLPCGVAVLSREKDAPAPADTEYPFVARIALSEKAIRGQLHLRPRKEGERIALGGQHKLLRKLPAMAAYPPSVRAHMPLPCDDAGVLAVPGGPVRDGAAAQAELFLQLYFY